MHGLHDFGCRDCPGMRETLQQWCEAEKMIAMSVGEVNCGEVLAARDDPAQQSLRLLDREKSVDEFATHISSSLPAGRSRVRPGRLIVSTSQLRPASVVVSVIHGLHDYLR